MNVAKTEPYVPEIVVEISAFASKLQSLEHMPFCSIELIYDHRMVKKIHHLILKYFSKKMS
jgi:hypothetical protein